MSFTARMGAWGPVPCRLGPSPGPLGRLPGGGPGPNSNPHFPFYDTQCMSKIDVDFDVVFLSFWGRSWVPLGGNFRSFWRFFRPRLVPEPSSNRLIFEKVICHEIIHFPLLLGVWCSHAALPKRPRSLQDGSLIV